MNKALIIIRSLIFNLFFLSWGIIASVIFLPLLFILPAKPLAASVGNIWASFSLFGLKVICGITHEIRGIENLPKQPCIIVSKHQSAWETMIFYKLVKYPAFVLKKELVSIPLYGKYLKSMDSIVIDRSAGAKALKGLVNDAKDRLEDGRTIIIFPEGSRIKVDEDAQFQPGVSALYSRCDVPVIPVALNSGLCWGRNSFIKKPGKIILEFLPAIEPELRRDQFMDKIQNLVLNKTQELVKEGNK